MVIIHAKIKDQILTTDCLPRLIIEGSKEQVYAALETDAEWDGLSLVMAFDNTFAEQPIPPVFVTDKAKIPIPWEALVNGDLSIGVQGYGERGEKALTTKAMKPLRVCKAGPIALAGAIEPSPEIWEQIIAAIGNLDDLQTTDKSNLVAAINEALSGGGSGGVSKVYVDDQDRKTLDAAKKYTDDHSSKYDLPTATRDTLGGIKAEPARQGETKGVYIDKQGFLHVAPDVLVVQATNEGGRWVADAGAETIRSFYGDVILKAEVDGIPYIYRYQRYGTIGGYTGAIFDQANLQPDAIERIEVVVDRNGNVNVVHTPYTPPVQTTVATCYDEAAPSQLAPNIWYVSKDLPRPTGAVGTMIDVHWVHGRVDGLGYDVKLIWGAPDGPDNELILDKINTADHLTGEYNIPVEGTVRYQLVETSGHKHWQYVSGPVIPRQFSSATAAAEPDKVVPGMELSYIPGQEIYVQLDQGNTADVARIVPAEGPTLPVYGNGAGARTGTIPAGYILHLANAGDHWQVLNSPGGGSGGAANAAELPAVVPAGLTADPNVQAVLDALAAKGGGSGLSAQEQKLIITIMRNGVYTTDQSQNITDLENLFGGGIVQENFKITNTLKGCRSNNPTVTIREGENYTAIITANSGFTMDGATVTVTMGGTNITGSAYANGTITIPSVTGDISVYVSAKQVVIPGKGIVTDGLIFRLNGLNMGSDPHTWTDEIGGLVFNLNTRNKAPNGVIFAHDLNNRAGISCETETIFETKNSTFEFCASDFSGVNLKYGRVIDNRATNERSWNVGIDVKNKKWVIGSDKQPNLSTLESKLTFPNSVTLSLSEDMGIENLRPMTKGTVDYWTPSATSTVSIGAKAIDGDQIQGTVHEVRIYNRVLTEEERRQNQQYDIDTYFGGGV